MLIKLYCEEWFDVYFPLENNMVFYKINASLLLDICMTGIFSHFVAPSFPSLKVSLRNTSFIDYAKAFDYVDHNKLWKILREMGIPSF